MSLSYLTADKSVEVLLAPVSQVFVLVLAKSIKACIKEPVA